MTAGHYDAIIGNMNRTAKLEELLYPLALLWKEGYEERGDDIGAITSITRGSEPPIRLAIKDARLAYEALKDTAWFKEIDWRALGGSSRVRQVLRQVAQYLNGFITSSQSDGELMKFAAFGLVIVTNKAWMLTLRGLTVLKEIS